MEISSLPSVPIRLATSVPTSIDLADESSPIASSESSVKSVGVAELMFTYFEFAPANKSEALVDWIRALGSVTALNEVSSFTTVFTRPNREARFAPVPFCKIQTFSALSFTFFTSKPVDKMAAPAIRASDTTIAVSSNTLREGKRVAREPRKKLKLYPRRTQKQRRYYKTKHDGPEKHPEQGTDLESLFLRNEGICS